MEQDNSLQKLTSIKSLVGILVFFCLLIFCFLYARDVKQLNPESIFLTNMGLKDYGDFSKKIHNPDIIVAKVKFNHSISSSDFEWVKSIIKKMEIDFPGEMKFLTYDSLYHKSVLLKNFEMAKSHFIELENGVRFLGNDFISFIIYEVNSIPKSLLDGLHNNVYFKKESVSISLAGHPYTNYLLDGNSAEIKNFLFPLMFFLAFVIIFLLTRKFSHSLMIFLPGIFSALLGLTFIKFLFVHMNMITSIIPLLLFVVNLSFSLHLYYAYIEFQSIKKVLELKLKPLFLMIVTTSIGFGSLVLSEIVVIRQFAYLTCLLISISGAVTLLWFLCSYQFIFRNSNDLELISSKSKFVKDCFFEKGLKPALIYILSFIFLCGGIFFASKLKIMTDATMYFSKKSGFKETIDDVSSTVAGVPLYEILLTSSSDVFSYNELKSIYQMEKGLESKLLKGQYLLSMNTMVVDVNQHYSGTRSFPPLSFSYFPLMSQVDLEMQKNYPLSKHYRITILGKTLNVNEYLSHLDKLKLVLNNHLDIKPEINGLYFNLMNSQKNMVEILAISFFLSLLLVCLISFLYFRSIKILLIFLLVNTIPVCIAIIGMYMFGLSLNIATVMTFSISMGMIVDSSFHIIHALKDNSLEFFQFLKTTIYPVILSSFLFIICFLCFVPIGFLPISQFGLILSVMLGLGLIFDLYILPPLFLGGADIKGKFSFKIIRK